MLNKKVTLSTTIIYGCLAIGLAAILFVGLMSGLVARPKNCKQPSVTTSVFTQSSSTSRQPSSTPIVTTPLPETTRSSSIVSTTSSSTSRTTQAMSSSSTVSISTSTQNQNRTLPSTTTQSTAEPYTPIRLPTNLVEPISYDLSIKTFFNPYFNPSDTSTERFEGSVKINFRLNRNSNYVRLHAAMLLNIVNNTISLRNLDTNTEYPVTIQRLKNEIVSINSLTQIQSGNYLLSLDFNSIFGFLSSLYGFYRTRYTEDGVTKTILATQFEPTDARNAFPCFDEPALKATFKISIEHPSNSIALSNWPGVESNIGNNRKRTSFETTYKMSTYLVAFVIAPDDFGYVEQKTLSGIPIRVYGRKSAARNKLLDFAKGVAVDVVNFFENTYFQIKEALPKKIDLIGLPNFQSGAMENWGLITFREQALFSEEKSNSIVGKQNIGLIVAHELAHFWFGNLVTPSWWNDLWLNEAMATFLEYKAISEIYPKWDVLDQFIALNLIPVMYDDGFESSQPVYNEVNDPDEIGSLFSTITYDKGASLLFMLESTVGSDNFRDGLRNYINTNKFGSGNAADFYKTLVLPKEMQEKGVTVQQYMENWLNQINYPHVEILLKNDQSQSVVDFVQERFSLSVFDENFFPPILSPYGYIWKIYLQCYAGGQGNDPFAGSIDSFNFYLDTKSASLKLNKKYTWVKCNKDFKGFYLSSYTEQNFDNLVNALSSKPSAFSIADRANLLHNSFSLAFEGTESYFKATTLGNYLINEVDYIPWRVFIYHINKISRIAEHKPSFRDIRYYSFYLIAKLREKIDISNDQGTDTERLLKANLIEFLCRLQESSCLKYSRERFNAIPTQHFTYPENPDYANPISGNYRRIVYKYHIQNTNDYDDWFKVNKLYLLSNDPFEKRYSLAALGASRLSWTLDQLLFELLEDNSYIRPQDFYDVIADIGKNPNGRHQVWAFIREYWYAITYEYGNSRAFANAIKSICESFDNIYLLEEVLELFGTTPDGSGIIERRQTIDIIFNNIFWSTSREYELQEAFFSGKSFNQTRFI